MKRLWFVLSAGLIAAFATALPTAAAADNPAPWHVYNLAPSGNALTSPVARGQGSDLATFDFLDTPTTSYLLNNQIASDLTGKTLTATFSVDGSGTMFSNPDGGAGSATVRFFFQTSNAGGFDETDYWWSNSVSAVLTVGAGGTITASLGGPATWSDFYGHYSTDPLYAAGFAAAASNATYVGLSFGGGFFFANGVGVAGGTATFHLSDFSVS